MKWALACVFVLIGLVALVAVVGAILPKDHVASRKADYAASPKSVFAAIVDVAAQPTWRKDVERVELLPDVDGHRRFREHSRHGKITFEVVEQKENERLVVRIADDDLPFGGVWTYELKEHGTGCELRVTERGEVKNVIYRFMSRFVFGHTRTMEGYLVALGTKLGEQVVPE